MKNLANLPPIGTPVHISNGFRCYTGALQDDNKGPYWEVDSTDGETVEFFSISEYNQWALVGALAPVMETIGATASNGTEHAERLAAIRQRLAATPGLPWAVDEEHQQIWSPSIRKYIGTEGTEADPEIAFIVHASEDIAYLLALLPAA